mgnify:CR=1 FL=1
MLLTIKMSIPSYRFSILGFAFDEENTYQSINNAFKLTNGLKSNTDTYIGKDITIELEDYTANIYFHTSYCPELNWQVFAKNVNIMCSALGFDKGEFIYEVYDSTIPDDSEEHAIQLPDNYFNTYIAKPILIIEEEDEEEEQIIKPALLTMKPRELKRLANNIIDELKVKVNQLKMTELTKQQKKLNTEYKDELYWKGLAEHIDASKERELQDEYLQFIPKLINGTTGKPTEFRIVELLQLIWHLDITKTSDYENEHSYSRQVCLAILSNWK